MAAEDSLSRAEELVPVLRAASQEIERARQLPPAVVDLMRDAGVFRVARRSFVDNAVFEAERSRIFDRCWLYLGHSSEAFTLRTWDSSATGSFQAGGGIGRG